MNTLSHAIAVLEEIEANVAELVPGNDIAGYYARKSRTSRFIRDALTLEWEPDARRYLLKALGRAENTGD